MTGKIVQQKRACSAHRGRTVRGLQGEGVAFE